MTTINSNNEKTFATLETKFHSNLCFAFPYAIFEVAGQLRSVVVKKVASWGDVTENLALLLCVDVPIHILIVVVC